VRGAASIQHLSLDGETLVHVAGGKAGTVKSGGGGDKTYGITARMELDWTKFQEHRFDEAMRHLGEVFYHPTMKGLDWRAVTAAYRDLARRARTTSEFDEIAGRQLGELNASHLGIRSPSAPNGPKGVANGRLGIDVMPDEAGPGWRVTSVLKGGPAEAGSMWLLVGDVITAVDGEPCPPSRPFLPHLRGKSGEEVLLTIRRPRETEEPLEISLLLRAISSRQERQLLYDAWMRGNAEFVHELSGGRVGYLHIRAMSGGSLRDFERDLYAAAEGRDGLLVDVRNNGGGSTADRVLASIMVRPHAYTVPRGSDPDMTDGYPQDRLFIQRYTRPMSMLCNEKSFSNAEIVSHAFKNLDRGTLVGEQTYGGVISTGGHALRDGTWMRTPFRGWYLPDGTDMENNGAMPDLHVPQTPEAESAGDDEQLRRAVDELMGRLPPR
jgi:tricorn protease